jgi:hypothetical protein
LTWYSGTKVVAAVQAFTAIEGKTGCPVFTEAWENSLFFTIQPPFVSHFYFDKQLHAGSMKRSNQPVRFKVK